MKGVAVRCFRFQVEVTCLCSASLSVLCPVPVKSVTYGLKGSDVVFDPFVAKKPDSILWKHNGNKVVETGATWEKIYDSYDGRVILNLSSARLLISDLRLNDSGEYELEISTGEQWKMLPKMELKVIGDYKFFPIFSETSKSVNIYNNRHFVV